MAVAAAAATAMASRAEAARPRRSTAARTSIRRNIEAWGEAARRLATSGFKLHLSSFTPQRVYGIKLYRAPYGYDAAAKGDDHSDGQNHRQKHRLDRDLRIENGMSDLAGQQ